MGGYLQAVAGALVAVVICLLLSRYGGDMTLLVTLMASAMVLMAAIRYLEPVIDLLDRVRGMITLDDGYIATLLKAVGIGLIGEVAAMICADGGNSALGKGVEILTAAVVLWLSVPMMVSLLELVLQLTGEL